MVTGIAILVLLMSLIPFAFHVRAYLRLLASFKAKGINVTNLEPEFLDYGSRGFIRKIRMIEGDHLQKGVLSEDEENMLIASKRAYYGMAPFLFGFIVVLGFVLAGAV